MCAFDSINILIVCAVDSENQKYPDCVCSRFLIPCAIDLISAGTYTDCSRLWIVVGVHIVCTDSFNFVMLISINN